MYKRQKIGLVISTNLNKTIKVSVFQRTLHPKYKKIYIKRKNFLVHDVYNKTLAGDYVVIEECSPISKLKNWKLKHNLTQDYKKSNK